MYQVLQTASCNKLWNPLYKHFPMQIFCIGKIFLRTPKIGMILAYIIQSIQKGVFCMKHSIMTIAAAGLLLTACGTQASGSAEQTAGIFSDYGGCYGEYYLYADPINHIAKLADLHTLESAPVCNKPNCTHRAGCIASMSCQISGMFPPAVIYNEHLYFFVNTKTEIVESPDGRAAEYYTETQLRKGDISTGSVETVLTLENADPVGYSTIYLAGSTLYFLTGFGAMQSENGTWSYFSAAGEQHLYAADLDTGELTDHGIVNDAVGAQNGCIVIGNSTFGLYQDVKMDGVFQNQLWFHFMYPTDKEDAAAWAQQEMEADGKSERPNQLEAFDWTTEQRCFDLQTQTWVEPTLPPAVKIQNGWYLWREGTTVHALSEDGTEQLLDCTGANPKALDVSWNVVNGKAFWICFDETNINLMFDLETGARQEYQRDWEHNPASTASPIAYLDGQYVLLLNGELYKLTEEEILHGAPS